MLACPFLFSCSSLCTGSTLWLRVAEAAREKMWACCMRSIHCKDEDRCPKIFSASRNVPFRKVASLEMVHREMACLALTKQSQGAMKFNSASFCVHSCHHWPSVVHLPVTEAQDHRGFHKETCFRGWRDDSAVKKTVLFFQRT